jgi:hypothetical protein
MVPVSWEVVKAEGGAEKGDAVRRRQELERRDKD